MKKNKNCTVGVENEKVINNTIVFHTCLKYENTGFWGGAVACQVSGSH